MALDFGSADQENGALHCPLFREHKLSSKSTQEIHIAEFFRYNFFSLFKS